MKYNNLIKLGLFLLSLCFLTLVSCSSDENKSGTPSLNDVVVLGDSVPITKANMGDWIAIKGHNITDVQSIHFNDVEVDMEEVFAEEDIIYLSVPVKIPIETTNKIYIKTRGGETAIDFATIVPPLELSFMQNEYAAEGDTIKIYGKFLELYEVSTENTKLKIGDLETRLTRVTETYIQAIVPKGVKENVKVSAYNEKYDATAVCNGFYFDKNNIITTFDDDYPYTHPKSQHWIGEWEHPRPISGKYIRFEINDITFPIEDYPYGLGWFYLLEMGFKYTEDMKSNPQNYVLKFELNMLDRPIKNTKFIFYCDGATESDFMYGDQFNVQTYGKWETKSIPLEKILKTEKAANDASVMNLRIEGWRPLEELKMYFDNFRIYKKGS